MDALLRRLPRAPRRDARDAHADAAAGAVVSSGASCPVGGTQDSTPARAVERGLCHFERSSSCLSSPVVTPVIDDGIGRHCRYEALTTRRGQPHTARGGGVKRAKYLAKYLAKGRAKSG
ncbi:hypothetical protein FGB62_33g178 [Gracilaria domingensis]|nr:hypothetical protein FGB62_33g178 [Gracilaria domingensis]